MVNSIKEFVFNNPITIDKDNVIVTGHTMYEASKILNLKQAPCLALLDTPFFYLLTRESKEVKVDKQAS